MGVGLGPAEQVAGLGGVDQEMLGNRPEGAEVVAELVRVPDVLLPDDLKPLGTVAQHLLVDSSKARDLLGWTETDRHEALARSVAWHLANPPPDADADFSADDGALAAAG